MKKEIFINEFVTVEKVEGGVAHVSARIPLEMVDSILALVDHLLDASRWVDRRIRCVAPASRPSKWHRVLG